MQTPSALATPSHPPVFSNDRLMNAIQLSLATIGDLTSRRELVISLVYSALEQVRDRDEEELAKLRAVIALADTRPAAETPSSEPPQRRGRPKGSKNKPKTMA